MDLDPQVPPYSTADKTSFASVSAQERWPTIITGAIDDVHRTTGNMHKGEARQEGKGIIEALAKLKYELQHNRQLTPIEDDSQPDIALYNNELKERGNPIWHNVSWLYSECYLYRRMSSLFARSQHWKTYDIFARQKLDTLKSSKIAVVDLAAQYNEIIQRFGSESPKSGSSDEKSKSERILFEEMAEACLWGNATDLSLLTNLTYDDLQKLQDSKARKAQESTILVNGIPDAFDALKKAQQEKPDSDRRVDFALDNAGFELYADLIFAQYLLASGLATNIVLHAKSIPWFVSDVIPADFGALLNALVDPAKFFDTLSADEQDSGKQATPITKTEKELLAGVFSDLTSSHAEGKMAIRPHRFWTHPGSSWRMPVTAPDLFADLRQSDLVILKGDLNGRKLVGDVMWDPTTSFEDAIGPLAKKGSGLRVLQLRTCKADVVVGLKPGEDERLRATEGGGGDSGARKWAWSGKWAVVQYHDGL